MEALVKIIGDIFSGDSSSSISMGIFFACLALYVVIKAASLMKENGFLGFTKTKATQDDVKDLRIAVEGKVAELKTDVGRDTTRIEDSIKDVENKLETLQTNIAKLIHYNATAAENVDRITNMVTDMERKAHVDTERLNSMTKEFETFTRDSKDKNSDMHKAINDINQSLASLHGSILAINGSGRTKLK
jgi:chromosome segregation ATPase